MNGAGRILVVGACVLDRLFYVEHLPKPGETAIGSEMEVHPGGKGANQALAARLMGAEVRLISAVGRDRSADTVLDPLVRAGVDVGGVERIADVATAEAVISVDRQGENMITACPGAYHRVDEAQLRRRVEDFVWADWLLIQNELPAETVRAAMEMGLEHQLRIVFNPAPFKRGMPHPPKGLELLVANVVEAAGLLAVEDYLEVGSSSREPLWRGLGAHRVIVTLGRHGGEVFSSDAPRFSFEAFEVDALDTVGAGDAFCGILTARLAGGAELREAVRWANAGAAMCVTRHGAQSALPGREELEAFLARHAG